MSATPSGAAATPDDRSPRLLLAAGSVGVVAVGIQLFALLQESDLSTPVGRFRALAKTIPQVAPMLGAAGVLVAGSWDTTRPWARRATIIALALFAAVCLAGAVTVIPDAQRLADNPPTGAEASFAIEITRSLVVLPLAGVLLGLAARGLYRHWDIG
jgi:hypothetical protein